MNKYIENFIKYKALIIELVIRDVKIKYRRSFLGIFWSLINPLLMMMVLNIVFSDLFKIEIDNFLMYLLTGQILFAFLSEATSSAMQSVISNASLIKKVYIPKYIFPISKVMSSFVNLLFSLLAIFIMMMITKVEFSVSLIMVIPLFCMFLIFVMGIGILLSSVTVFFRDIIYLYGIFISIWMYFTPIMYPQSIIPEKYSIVIMANPLYYYIKYFRLIVMDGKFPDLYLSLVCLIIALLTFILGLIVFKKVQDKFILYI